MKYINNPGKWLEKYYVGDSVGSDTTIEHMFKRSSIFLKNNKECVLAALQHSPDIIRYVKNKNIFEDKEVMMAAKEYPYILNKLGPKLRKDKQFVLDIIKDNKNIDTFNLSYDYLLDKEIVIALMENTKKGTDILHDLPSELLNNKEFKKEASRILSNEIGEVDREIDRLNMIRERASKNAAMRFQRQHPILAKIAEKKANKNKEKDQQENDEPEME